MLVVCGESLVDLISDSSSSGYIARPGGSPLNVAVGAARLGVPTSLLTRFGSGRLGEVLRSHATASGVDVSQAIIGSEPATLAVVSLNAAGAAQYEFYVDGTAGSGWRASDMPDPLPDDTQVLHVGSIASWREPASHVITDLVRRESECGAVLISYDPNLRPSLVQDADRARTRVEHLVDLAHVVKVSIEDLGWLCPNEPPEAAGRRWSQAGPALVILTDGPAAIRAYQGGHVAVALPAPVIPAAGNPAADTVGAGDAFTAGLLAALAEENRLTPGGVQTIDDASLRAVLGSAGMVAALTCARSGADPPTRAERDAALRSIASA